MKKRVLLSLEMAVLGNSGIPQENRLMTRALLAGGRHHYAGLLMEARNNFTVRLAPRRPTSPVARPKTVANFLVGLSGHDTPDGLGKINRHLRKLWLLDRIYKAPRDGYAMQRVPKGLFDPVIWRLLFEKTLSPADRDLMASLDLHLSRMSVSDFYRPRDYPFAPEPLLQAPDFDAVVFHDARPVRLPPTTAKIIRYHDAIPITHPDLLGDGNYTSVHHEFVSRCVDNAWFVCNSNATREELLSLFPRLEKFTRVIPCTLSTQVESDPIDLPPLEIIRRRHARPEKLPMSKAALAVLEGGPKAPKTVEYVLAVAALEPKKNIPGLIAAFERVKQSAANPNLKLVLVGSPSWAFDRIVSRLNPHLRSGDAFHLVDVPQPELRSLLRNARLLCFPSLAEGFGYPPIEALVEGTPSVVADIPALRETMGDTALYVDPYDPNAIAEAMLRLLDPETGDDVKASLMAGRDAHLAKFDAAATADKWADFFEEVRPRVS